MFMINQTNISLLKLRSLPIFNDLSSMSRVTGFSEQLLYYYAISDDAKKYTIFEIPKKDSCNTRKIYAPNYALKILQRWILENILYKIECSEYAFAFKRDMGSPLKKNALVHKEHVFLLEMDLENFFHSIKRQRIVYLFSNLGYNVPISNWLANICTYEDILPQGSVTAPYLSNLVCLQLDKRIAKYCSKRDIVYSRYADDITFSCSNKAVIKSIYGTIKKIIESEHFTINQKKTRFIGKSSRKSVTGVIIDNDCIKAPKEYKRLVRCLIHRAIISGDYSNINRIRGYIAYISSIEDDYMQKVVKYINTFKTKRDVIFLDSTVEMFNANIFLPGVDQISQIRMTMEEEDNFGDYVTERLEFLKKRHMKVPPELGKL
ncbi:RNA-directed DNA polymerase [Eisenbergiella sp. OF01-20]|nr:RNA-directed DNA polymerase [Eisenbergiella sp. OF01-20]